MSPAISMMPHARLRTVAAAASLLAGITACVDRGQDATPDGPRADSVASLPAPPERPWRPGIRFSPDTMRPGMRVGELALDSLTPFDPANGRDAKSAYFSGEITLSGSTMRHPDDDAAKRLVCFEADSASATRMPRWEGDERRLWFCFTNVALAARMVARPGEVRPATVVIDRYVIHVAETDVVNSARLVR